MGDNSEERFECQEILLVISANIVPRVITTILFCTYYQNSRFFVVQFIFVHITKKPDLLLSSYFFVLYSGYFL